MWRDYHAIDLAWLGKNSGHCLVIAPKMTKPCPWLPTVTSRIGPESTRVFAGNKGSEFYLAALSYAQSLWLEGKPAQAILQLNKAWMADLEENEPVLDQFPSPYPALIWLIQQSRSGDAGFMGNPVRHFQHLASRMSGPRSEIRRWRAWACFHLTTKLLTAGNFPMDGSQIAREGLWIPSEHRTKIEISAQGWSDEIVSIDLASTLIRHENLVKIGESFHPQLSESANNPTIF